MKENYTSHITYKCNYNLLHKGNIPMLWLTTPLEGLHELEVEKVIVILRIINLLLQYPCEHIHVQVQHLNRKKEKKTHSYHNHLTERI